MFEWLCCRLIRQPSLRISECCICVGIDVMSVYLWLYIVLCLFVYECSIDFWIVLIVIFVCLLPFLNVNIYFCICVFVMCMCRELLLDHRAGLGIEMGRVMLGAIHLRLRYVHIHIYIYTHIFAYICAQTNIILSAPKIYYFVLVMWCDLMLTWNLWCIFMNVCMFVCVCMYVFVSITERRSCCPVRWCGWTNKKKRRATELFSSNWSKK